MYASMEYSTASTAPGSSGTPEWLELFDPQTRRVVYANIVTGQCSWTRPTSPIAARDPRGEWWELVDDETGVPYYYNSTTGATEWEVPADATVVPFHALLTSSVGKRLSMLVSNRGSVAFTSDEPGELVRKASRASLHSDGRASRKGSMARKGSVARGSQAEAQCEAPPELQKAPAEINLYEPDSKPPQTHASPQTNIQTYANSQIPVNLHADSDLHKASSPAEKEDEQSAIPQAIKSLTVAAAQLQLESGTRSGGASAAGTRRGSSQRHSQSETALETLKEVDDDESTTLECGDYDVPASATAETFRRSEMIERLGADAVMLHAARNRSMPAMRAEETHGLRAFASTQFAAHKRGFLRRRVPLDELVSYTPALTRPLLNLPRELTRDALRSFSAVQAALTGEALDPVLWLCNAGVREPALRDEILCQIGKQITGNPSAAAVQRGWALLSAALHAFGPSPRLHPHLAAFAATAPTLRLRRLLHVLLARTRQERKPRELSSAELRLVLAVPRRLPVFGAALPEIMASPELMDACGLPHVLVRLTSLISALHGDRAEGLFRVPADGDAVAAARLRIEAGEADLHVDDPHVAASLLKEWLRDLAEPLVPASLHKRCVMAPDAEAALRVMDAMPAAAARVLDFLLCFLGSLLRPEAQACTRMDASNLALVFAPVLLRCPAKDLKDVIAASSGEQGFVMLLLSSYAPAS
ncbi:hypothetical protein LPJ78_002664 [Coemansia sp. RSA 989]|nr:hypothetical protein LPJ78_002664 [Coemansia sp. RSA 989]